MGLLNSKAGDTVTLTDGLTAGSETIRKAYKRIGNLSIAEMQEYAASGVAAADVREYGNARKAEGRAEGREEGREEGRAEGRAEAIQAMKAAGFSDEVDKVGHT